MRDYIDIIPRPVRRPPCPGCAAVTCPILRSGENLDAARTDGQSNSLRLRLRFADYPYRYEHPAHAGILKGQHG